MWTHVSVDSCCRGMTFSLFWSSLLTERRLLAQVILFASCFTMAGWILGAIVCLFVLFFGATQHCSVLRVEKLGYPVPKFDFRVPGVTSMTADIHKYGFGTKVSVRMAKKVASSCRAKNAAWGVTNHGLVTTSLFFLKTLNQCAEISEVCVVDRVPVWCCIAMQSTASTSISRTHCGLEAWWVHPAWRGQDPVRVWFYSLESDQRKTQLTLCGKKTCSDQFGPLCNTGRCKGRGHYKFATQIFSNSRDFAFLRSTRGSARCCLGGAENNGAGWLPEDCENIDGNNSKIDRWNQQHTGQYFSGRAPRRKQSVWRIVLTREWLWLCRGPSPSALLDRDPCPIAPPLTLPMARCDHQTSAALSVCSFIDAIHVQKALSFLVSVFYERFQV